MSGEESDEGVEYRDVEVQGQTSKLIVLKLPELGSRKVKEWVFCRALE